MPDFHEPTLGALSLEGTDGDAVEVLNEDLDRMKRELLYARRKYGAGADGQKAALQLTVTFSAVDPGGDLQERVRGLSPRRAFGLLRWRVMDWGQGNPEQASQAQGGEYGQHLPERVLHSSRVEVAKHAELAEGWTRVADQVLEAKLGLGERRDSSGAKLPGRVGVEQCGRPTSGNACARSDRRASPGLGVRLERVSRFKRREHVRKQHGRWHGVGLLCSCGGTLGAKECGGVG